ncbi:MAG TPA: hypothetical protein VK506_13670, partial [Conexibacter sp.]|nr:hypothetical protein [Conexibacter sp.]
FMRVDERHVRGVLDAMSLEEVGAWLHETRVGWRSGAQLAQAVVDAVRLTHPDMAEGLVPMCTALEEVDQRLGETWT